MYLWNYKRPLAANTRKNAGRSSNRGEVPSGVLYVQCLLPHKGAAKHSCYFLELCHGELRRMPLLRSSLNRETEMPERDPSAEEDVSSLLKVCILCPP
jgi:hypothetical protein